MARPSGSPAETLRGPRLVDAEELRRLAADPASDVLAVTCFGAPPAGVSPWLTARVPNVPLAAGLAAEVWPSARAVHREELYGVCAAVDGVSLYATMEIDGITGETLEEATCYAYVRLMHTAGLLGCPHLVRLWNFVPGINDRSAGLERYMLFCKGRCEAFTLGGSEPNHRPLPAASAVGSPGQTLIVHALASCEAGEPVENPRQVSSYHYPSQYGPKPPVFARGMKAPRPWNGALFVSGTASILGHESVFPGDPVAQAEESLRNIEAVLDAAGIAGEGGTLGQRLHGMRIYVRHESHQPILLEAMDRFLKRTVPTVWLQAEICREELLVEIEATVLAPTP